MEPPLSVAWAAGTMPAATAQAEPPLDPPALRCGSNGFLVAPNKLGAVQMLSPNSGVLVFPRITRPAVRKREIRILSVSGTCSRKARLPFVAGTPSIHVFKSLTR